MANDTTEGTRDTLIDIAPYNDDELFDRAMRELEILERTERANEAAKRGLETLRQCGQLRAFCKAFAMAGALMATVAFGSAAGAEDKPKKPTMCLSGQPVEAKGGFKGFLCTDGKRPRILVRYTVVQFVNETGDGATYVLGWPTAAKSPKVTPVVGGIKL